MSNVQTVEEYTEVSFEQKEKFKVFIQQLKDDSYNCSPVAHTNHKNHSNW